MLQTDREPYDPATWPGIGRDGPVGQRGRMLHQRVDPTNLIFEHIDGQGWQDLVGSMP